MNRQNAEEQLIMSKKYIIITLICIAMSVLSGIITRDF